MKVKELKIVLSLIFIVIGVALGFSLTHAAHSDVSTTMTIDFGSYNIVSGELQEGTNASAGLYNLCQECGFEITYGEEGEVSSIDGKPSAGDTRTWRLYFINDSKKWEIYDGDPSTLVMQAGSVISWGLFHDGEYPTPAVDATGYSYYNLGVATRIVCLAPSVTETVCALGCEDLIVGTDMYSNYPKSVEMKRKAGIIAETGSYTTPSFETIVDLKPDLVIGISSQYTHGVVVQKLRGVGIHAILVNDGVSLQDVYDNTYITGVAMGISDDAIKLTQKLKEQVEQTNSYVSSISEKTGVMVALSPDKAPWIAGDNTYIADIYTKAGAFNSFGGSVDGWRQINPESIVEKDPQVIIIISPYQYSKEAYDYVIANLSEEWKATTAYKNGDIYLFSDSAADILQRPATRLAQMTEILGRLLHPEAFTELIEVPKYIGDDYVDYITYSKEL